MSAHAYSLVAADASEEGDNEFSHPSRGYDLVVKRTGVFIAVCTLFVVSLSVNALLLYQRFHQPWKLYNNLPSQYAGLRRNVPKEMVPSDHYSSLNRTIQNIAWNEPNLVSWDLFVALEEDYVISQHLPHSQRWPWDSSKGVYIPYAAHELHCVHVLRSYVNDMEDRVAKADMDWGYSHAIHCLNILRESIMCNADDQPMYTGRLHANVHFEEAVPGRGTIKMCRDWNSLVAWAHSHSACYTSINRKDPNFLEIDRYKHCPDGSRPWEDQ